MYLLNKFVWFVLNPLSLALAGIAVGVLLTWKGRVRAGIGVLGLVAALLWIASTPLASVALGLPLERDYLTAQVPEQLPRAEAIVLLGGGIGKCESLAYPDMSDAADRVWHAARLYRAGKAPRVVVSGRGELSSAVPLLRDFGVPGEAIAVDNKSRNTYENSRFVERLLGGNRTVLLVTSAWHMPRALGNFSRTSLRAIPAAADFKATYTVRTAGSMADWVMPSAEKLSLNATLVKEWMGRLARK